MVIIARRVRAARRGIHYLFIRTNKPYVHTLFPLKFFGKINSSRVSCSWYYPANGSLDVRCMKILLLESLLSHLGWKLLDALFGINIGMNTIKVHKASISI